MKRKEIEEQAERITNSFSYRKGYSTPKDAFISAVEWTLARVSDWIDQRSEQPLPSHDQQCDWEDGFIGGLYAVGGFLEIDEDVENK